MAYGFFRVKWTTIETLCWNKVLSYPGTLKGVKLDQNINNGNSLLLMNWSVSVRSEINAEHIHEHPGEI